MATRSDQRQANEFAYSHGANVDRRIYRPTISKFPACAKSAPAAAGTSAVAVKKRHSQRRSLCSRVEPACWASWAGDARERWRDWWLDQHLSFGKYKSGPSGPLIVCAPSIDIDPEMEVFARADLSFPLEQMDLHCINLDSNFNERPKQTYGRSVVVEQIAWR